MKELFCSPFFGIALSIITFKIGIILNKKYRVIIFFPALIAIILIIVVLSIFNISFEDYNQGGKFISFFLGPVTVALAFPLYKNFYYIKRYYLVIIIGIFFSSIVSILSVYFLGKIFNIDDIIIKSLIPKSVTVAVSIELSKKINADIPITILATLITGLIGAIFSEKILKTGNIKNRVAKGVSIGSTFHGFGTIKALEIGEMEGAVSGLSIGIMCLVSSIILPFIILFLF